MSLFREFTIIETVYQSPFVRIIRAIRNRDQLPVILKTLGLGKSHPRQWEQLENDYTITIALKIQAILKPIDSLLIEGNPVLVFEDFEGRTLTEVMNARPMAIEGFLPLALKLTQTLLELHRSNIIHKNIKPDNILIAPDSGKLKLVDFGIASYLVGQNGAPGARASDDLRWIEGSLPYMSPEQTRRINRPIDNRSDLYSLGVSFFQILTGQLPFEATDPLGWVHCHIAQIPPNAHDILSSVPIALSNIVKKLLEKEADDRYQSAKGLIEDLEECQRQLKTQGAIREFDLARRDVSDRFVIPRKIYGRTQELATLTLTLEEVARNHKPKMILISGGTGVGKTSLAQELRQPVISLNGSFVFGKFDSFSETTPFSGILRAFDQLALQLMIRTDSGTGNWRQRLQSALGAHAGVMTELVPSLKELIGVQPAAQSLPPREAEQRFRDLVLKFLQCIAQPAHPLVLFLDDLQWIDLESLKIIEDVLEHMKEGSLFIVGTYRDTDIAAEHPLSALREKLTEIHLNDLPQGDLAFFVSDVTRTTLSESAPLTALVHQKTGGNPFFAACFMTKIHQEGKLWFDESHRAWKWDLELIYKTSHTDNLSEFMVNIFNGLSQTALSLLETAACLGSSSQLTTLSVAHGLTLVEIQSILQKAVDSGLVTLDSKNFLFAHDRIWQAAYTRIPEDARNSRHLKIGRILLAGASPDKLAESVYGILEQINRGANLVNDPTESFRLAELNLLAGRRAKSTGARQAALQFLSQAEFFLGDSGWNSHYDLTFNVFLEQTECAFLAWRYQDAETLTARLLERARSKIDKSLLLRLKSSAQLHNGDVPASVETGLECLRLLGVSLPARPQDAEVMAKFGQVLDLLGGRNVQELLELPAMIDPEKIALMQVLDALQTPAFYMDHKLLALILCHMVENSLNYGNTEASSLGFSSFGFLLSTGFQKYEEGYQWAKLGMQLAKTRGWGTNLFRLHVNLKNLAYWVRPIDEAYQEAEVAMRLALESGDIAAHSWGAATHLISDQLARSVFLPTISAELERLMEFIEKGRQKHQDTSCTLQTMNQFIRNLRGLTANFSTYSDDGFDQDSFERELIPQRMPSVIAWYCIYKLMARYLSGDIDQALEAGAKGGALLWATAGHSQVHDFRFFRALSLAAACDKKSNEETTSLLTELKGHLEQLREWSIVNPSTFLSTYSLISAEWERLHDNPLEAERLYEVSIDAAKRNRSLMHEAIAYESTSRFYKQRGFERISDAYLVEARARYLRWGADGKVKQLDRANPQILDQHSPQSSSTLALRSQFLDIASVVNASQSISKVIVLDELICTLLRIMLDQSGAQKGLLIFVKEGELSIEAEAMVEKNKVSVRTHTISSLPAEKSDQVPNALLRFCMRTGEILILPNALQDDRFCEDAYITRARAKSIICLPIRRQSEVFALVYAENNLLVDAFDAEKAAVLELLASQSAISLQNSLLLRDERMARKTAEEAEQRSAFLAEAGEIHSRSLNYHETISALARLSTRSVANACLIDIWGEKGAFEHAAYEHSDPSKRALLMELEERYARHSRRSTYLNGVLAAKSPVLVASTTLDWIGKTWSVDSEQAPLLEEFNAGSLMLLPLIVRGEAVGIITLILEKKTEGSRIYSELDFQTGCQLARLAETAIDNGRLFSEAKKSIELRDEFLAIASHELRTPITPLTIYLDLLKRHLQEIPASVSPKIAQLTAAMNDTDRELRYLSKLTEDLLDVSRIKAGNLVLNREEVNLRSLIQEVVHRFNPEFERAKCHVELAIEGEITGYWQKTRIQQILNNLLTNAIRYGGGKPIKVHASKFGGHASFSVQDYGEGIPRESQERIFNRFERASSSNHYGGMGLGLYISKALVQAHDGNIRVVSEPGKGALFTVNLPLQSSPQETSTLAGLSRTVPSASGQRRSPQEIG